MPFILFLFAVILFAFFRLAYLGIRWVYRNRPKDESNILRISDTPQGLVLAIAKSYLSPGWTFHVEVNYTSDSIIHKGDNVFNLVLITPENFKKEIAWLSPIDGVFSYKMKDHEKQLFIGLIYHMEPAEVEEFQE